MSIMQLLCMDSHPSQLQLVEKTLQIHKTSCNKHFRKNCVSVCNENFKMHKICHSTDFFSMRQDPEQWKNGHQPRILGLTASYLNGRRAADSAISCDFVRRV